MNRETMTSTQGATASPEFLRPKDISEIINDLFQYYFKNFGRILGIVALGYIPYFVLSFLLTAAYVLIYIFGILSVRNGFTPNLYLLLILVPIFFFLMIITSVGMILADAAIVYASANHALGLPLPKIMDAYRVAGRRFWRILGAGLLVGLAAFGLIITILGVAFAVYFLTVWSLALPIIVIENLGARKSLSRSAQLVKSSFWRVFGIGIVISLVVGGASVFAGYIPVLGLFVTPLVRPVQLIGSLILYFDLRVRKEGYTPARLAAELGLPDSSPYD